MEMKYIRSGFKFYIFPAMISHDDFADTNFVKRENITSAGFVSFDSEGHIDFYGKSVTLKAQSQKCDFDDFIRYHNPD